MGNSAVKDKNGKEWARVYRIVVIGGGVSGSRLANILSAKDLKNTSPKRDVKPYPKASSFPPIFKVIVYSYCG